MPRLHYSSRSHGRREPKQKDAPRARLFVHPMYQRLSNCIKYETLLYRVM